MSCEIVEIRGVCARREDSGRLSKPSRRFTGAAIDVLRAKEHSHSCDAERFEGCEEEGTAVKRRS